MKQFSPRVQVILHPIVSGGDTTDITDWFGDSCIIMTHKSTLEPAGSFTISFLDRRMGEDSVYARVAPMDGIEIRAAHDGSQPLQLLMRGFVSRVTREESMEGDGTPVRRVTLTGQDVGKIWLTQYLYFLPDAQDQIHTLHGYGILARYFGANVKSVSGAQFVRDIGAVLAEHVAVIVAGTRMGLVLDFAPEGVGDVDPQITSGMTDISFYQFMSAMLDAGAFYELWIDDPGDGPALLRWRYLWAGNEGATVPIDDIVSLRVWRDDSRTSNWYFCYPRVGLMHSQVDSLAMARAVSAESDGREDQWSAEKYFGYRKMEVEFALNPPGYPVDSDQPTKEQYIASQPVTLDWIRQLTLRLRNTNKDNAHLESCQVVMAGNESVRPGTWVTVQKADVSFRYYAAAVDHQINLWRSFRTTLTGMRGDKLSGQGTYRAERDLKGAQK